MKKDLSALKREWDQKLKESGFEDIEKEIKGERVLKSQSANQGRFAGIYRFTVDVLRETKEEYFRILAQRFANETSFSDEFDRFIMEKTVEGWTIREISTALRKKYPTGNGRIKHDRNTIRYVRRRYEHKWGIKTWEPNQMVSRRPPIK